MNGFIAEFDDFFGGRLGGNIGLERRIALGDRVVGEAVFGFIRGLFHNDELGRAFAREGLREVDISAGGVVGVEGDAIERDAFADTHVDALPAGAFDAAEQMALGAEQLAGYTRADDQLDAPDLVDIEQGGQFPERIAGHAFGLLHQPPAAAGGTVGKVDALGARAHALTGHLEDPELGDRGDGCAGAVALEAFAEAALDLLAVRE